MSDTSQGSSGDGIDNNLTIIPGTQPPVESPSNPKDLKQSLHNIVASSDDQIVLMKEQLSSLLSQCNQLKAQIDKNSIQSNSKSSDAPYRNPEPKIKETFKVATKVPPFYTSKPDLWFLQIEAQFRNNKITQDQTKYDIVISSLDPTYLDVVVDIIRNPPQENKYEAVKNALSNEFAQSQEKRLTKLIQSIDLGDKKPSTLLREMMETSNGMLSNEILELLWLRCQSLSVLS